MGFVPRGDYNKQRTFRDKTAAVALTGGQVVYLNSSGQWNKAIATAATTLGLGIIDNDYAANALVTVYQEIELDGYSSLTIGARVYLDPSTAGAVTQTQPSSANQYIQCIGVAVSATRIRFNFGPLPTEKIQASGSSTLTVG